MNEKEEKLTYEILEERFKEIDKLIAVGKMEKPKKIIRDFTLEEQDVINRGRTLEVITKELEQKYGKI